MTSLGELRVEATRENLRTISYFIHGISQHLQLTEKTLFDIDFAVEEAAANIVSHAYPENEKGDILVQVDVSGDVIHITLTDWGNPLDPRNVKPFDIHAPVETRIKGGMGLYFIQNLMDDVIRKDAQEPGGPNLLRLVKRIERLRPGVQTPSTLRELNAMLSVSRLMASTSDLDNLLWHIVNQLVETIDAESGTLYLCDKAQEELVSRVLMADLSDLHEVRIKIGEGIAGTVADTGRVLNIQNAHEDPRFQQEYEHLTRLKPQTVLAAPMHNAQKEIMGVVELINKKDGAFTRRDERLLNAMAAQAAISIENARLHAQEIQRQLLNRELETARAIQKSFLPEMIPQHPGWDIAAFWRPMLEVAGDFYDFYEMPDGRLGLVIADVSGKSVSAALFMALVVTVLRFAMSMELAPHEVMDRTNQAIISHQRSRMFVTIFAGYLDLNTGIMEFSCAGHNPPLVYRRLSGQCDYINTLGPAAGVFPSATFDCARASMEPGDILVLYTDGLTEIIDHTEEEFGEERLEMIVSLNAERSAQEIVDQIISAAESFAGGLGTFDDETLVVVKRT
jgi:sigma-B regulation protein RsbU (phosphoserine phosphatase)